MHLTYCYPCMEEAPKLLEVSVISQAQPSIDSYESSPTLPLVDDVVEPIQCSVNPTPPSGGDCDAT